MSIPLKICTWEWLDPRSHCTEAHSYNWCCQAHVGIYPCSQCSHCYCCILKPLYKRNWSPAGSPQRFMSVVSKLQPAAQIQHHNFTPPGAVQWGRRQWCHEGVCGPLLVAKILETGVFMNNSIMYISLERYFHAECNETNRVELSAFYHIPPLDIMVVLWLPLEVKNKSVPHKRKFQSLDITVLSWWLSHLTQMMGWRGMGQGLIQWPEQPSRYLWAKPVRSCTILIMHFLSPSIQNIIGAAWNWVMGKQL